MPNHLQSRTDNMSRGKPGWIGTVILLAVIIAVITALVMLTPLV